MLQRAASVLRKARERGPGWFLGRLARELTIPGTAPGLALRRANCALLAGVRHMRPGQAGDPDTLYAFYDLEVSPITYDFAWFMVGAELRRRELGLGRLVTVVVPGGRNGLREEIPEYDSAVPEASRRWRLGNIVIPLAALLPEMGLVVAPDRPFASALHGRARHVYPDTYWPMLPVAFDYPPVVDALKRQGVSKLLRAPAQAGHYVSDWLAARNAGDREVVTVTLRQQGFGRARNSDVAAWESFVARLDRSRFFPVIVPDTDAAIRETDFGGDVAVMSEAAFSVPLRAGLYERARWNLGVNCGPLALCYLNDNCQYIMYKLVADGVAQANEELHARRGFTPGQPFPFALPGQILVWEDDRLDVIERTFAAAVQHAGHGRFG
jgi:hypothetical protein